MTLASGRLSVRRQRWMLNIAQVRVMRIMAPVLIKQVNGPDINHLVSPISSPSDTRHHQGGINRLILIPKVSPSPEPLITINSRLLLSIRLSKENLDTFIVKSNFKISFYKIQANKRLQVPVGILGLLNTDCALNAFLAPGFYQESVTREIHHV